MTTDKFLSFEMVFGDGQTYMGNMILTCDDIHTKECIRTVEYAIKTKLNKEMEDIHNSDLRVDAVTLVNWKTL